MKLKLLFIGFFFSILSNAQIPAGYYNTATGTGYTLKTQLYNIIKDHTDNGYAGLYTTYQTSDRDYFYENDGTVLDMYSENPTGIDPYNYSSGTTDRCGNYSSEGDCYNREHIIPQSIFNSNSPMVADAHFITPTDGKVNGMRNNYPHGIVSVPTYTSKNGSKLGSSGVSGYSGTVFEPIDEFKGDIARMYFYFATRYENVITTWGNSYPMFDGSSDQVFTPAFLNMLLTWSAQDPVSPREIARNNAIYGTQNNRNPYIDHPEYVQKVWNPTPDTEAPTAATSLTVTGTTSSTVSLSWTAGTDNVAVTGYDIYMNGILKTSVSGVTGTINGLSASTTYSFYVIAKDAAVNSSPASNTVNGTTTVFVPDTQAPTAATSLAVTNTLSTKVSLSWNASTDNMGVTAYDIYVNSTYNSSVSGTVATISGLTASTAYTFYVIARDAAGNSSVSSNVVNGTTNASGTDSILCATESFENITAGASNYATRTWTGDSGLDWTATDARTDQTINTKSICIRNGALSALSASNGIGNLTVTTLLKFTGTSGTFNLFVNGNNVGTIPYSATLTTTTITGINTSGDVIVSLVNTSTSNRVSIDDLSWTCYSGLGLETLNEKEFKIYPNPSNGNFNIIFDDSNESHSVEIISLLGQKVFEKENSQSASISVNHLQKGTYLLKVTKGSKSRTEKIIIN